MIKIHNKLWFVKRVSPYKDDDKDLAYMTYYEDNSAFEARKETGTSWAEWGKRGTVLTSAVPEIVDNNPVSGFKIGDSVSRWSTQNKLFRVRDPRGFVVEVPTGNISTILQHTAVLQGEIQGECVWAREGSNHILLSVDSEPYKAALEVIKKHETELLKPKDLKAGDFIEEFGTNNMYYYAGFGKICYKNLHTNVTVVDNKNRHIFLGEWKALGGFYIVSPAIKISRIVSHDDNYSVKFPIDIHPVTERIRDVFPSAMHREAYNRLVLDEIVVSGIEFKER